MSEQDDEDVDTNPELKAEKRTSSDKPSPSTSQQPEKKNLSSANAAQDWDSTVPVGNLKMAAIKDKSDEDARAEAAKMTKADKEKHQKEKREARMRAIAALNEEQKKKKEERLATLTNKLIDRVSILTETDKGPDVTAAFKDKIQLEIESLKMESFGLEILHAMGYVYVQKASSFLRSQKFFGVTGFFNRARDKFTSAKDTLDAIVLARDTQKSLRDIELEKEEIQRMEKEKGGELTMEQKAEFEKKASGTMLGAALGAHTYEIRSVLREVCDRMLYDKHVSLEKRMERAKALVVIGDLCQKVQ